MNEQNSVTAEPTVAATRIKRNRRTIESYLGEKFGRLVVISTRREPPVTKVLCRCDCGNETETNLSSLTQGGTKSCGCWFLETRTIKKTHGLLCESSEFKKEYFAWKSMKQRVNEDTSFWKWKDYAGRGIKVCDRWYNSLENFLSDMGKCPAGMTLDRIDNEKGYSPDNCRWATRFQQQSNRRNNRWIEHNGERLILAEWERKIGLRRGGIRNRLKCGWSMEEALETPPNPRERGLKVSTEESKLQKP